MCSHPMPGKCSFVQEHILCKSHTFSILKVLSAQHRKDPERMTMKLFPDSFQSFFYECIHLKTKIKTTLHTAYFSNLCVYLF